MSKLVALFALVVVLLFGAFKLFPLISGPSILITSPAGGTTSAHTVLLAGVASRTETLQLNGSLLPIDAQGRFEKTLTLPSGGAILSLTATDRFGKQKTTMRSVLISE